MVDTMHAYPHLLHRELKHRFPYAVINVIVTAIGGEHSESGAARFERDVLCHRADVITIDYGLNDRGIGLEKARESWTDMIHAAQSNGAKVLLMTPTPDVTQAPGYQGDDQSQLGAHAKQIVALAREHDVGLVDSLSACLAYAKANDLSDILSWSNHPNKHGHKIVARELLRWFPTG
jgi:lysophospholipase L1-like esterase